MKNVINKIDSDLVLNSLELIEFNMEFVDLEFIKDRTIKSLDDIAWFNLGAVIWSSVVSNLEFRK